MKCLTLFLLALISTVNAAPLGPAMRPIQDDADLPRILLIGDSISIGYTLPVRELLKGRANVHRPPVNCQSTIHGLKSLDAWLATGGKGKKWDVIHFNWGLHDLKYMGPNGENLADPKAKSSHQQVAPVDFEKNLRQLVTRLKKTGARLVWRNTTPVPEGVRGRVPGDAAKYNLIAAKVMKDFGVEIQDLFTFTKAHSAKIQCKADVHFSQAGSRMLAAEIVKGLGIKEKSSR